VFLEVYDVVRADRGSDVSGEADDDLVGNVKLRRLPADSHHGGHPVNVVGDVLTGNVFGDRQTLALDEPH